MFQGYHSSRIHQEGDPGPYPATRYAETCIALFMAVRSYYTVKSDLRSHDVNAYRGVPLAELGSILLNCRPRKQYAWTGQRSVSRSVSSGVGGVAIRGSPVAKHAAMICWDNATSKPQFFCVSIRVKESESIALLRYRPYDAHLAHHVAASRLA